MSCRARHLRSYLAGLLYEDEGKAPNSQAISAALNVLEAEAAYKGAEIPLHVRVAEADGAIWYDLSDLDRRAIRIDPHGWHIESDPPTLFRPYAHQRPQPEPVAGGGDIRQLLRFVNLASPEDELLLLVYLVAALVPRIPHPILLTHGPQGSAKTTFFRLIRRLIDPSALETLSLERDRAQLAQQLAHHYAPLYDNISRIPEDVSDMLCRAVTGEGFSKRELYSDDDDVVYEYRRLVGLNGINITAEKPDLLDRCLMLSLEPIDADKRRPESEVLERFEQARPTIFAGMADALSKAMSLRPDVSISRLPRLADFALWGCAIAEALGFSHEGFLEAFGLNTTARNDEVLESNPVAQMVVTLMRDRVSWDGTPSELLRELDRLADTHHVDTRAKSWPKSSAWLTKRLNEVRTNLSAAGLNVEYNRESASRTIFLWRDSVTAGDPGNDRDDDTDDGGGAVPSRVSSSKISPDSSDSDGNDANDGILGDPLQTDDIES